MLKHCSPSSVDLRKKRSTDDPEAHFMDDSMSMQSYSTSSSSSSSSENNNNRVNTAFTSNTAVKDASTSPKSSPEISNKNKKLADKRKLLPLAMIAKQQQHHQLLRVPIKVYAKCLRSDIEYKTLSVTQETTSKEVIWTLMSKYRMKHRDPKLFYLTMDITIKRTGIPLKRSLSLDDDSRPVELKSCHPWGDCKFSLQMRKGGVVRIYDSILMKESKYKCLLVSENTTTEDIIKMLFHCYSLNIVQEQVNNYRVYEVRNCNSLSECDPGERQLSMNVRPMMLQTSWPHPNYARFVLRLIKQQPILQPFEMSVDEMSCYESSSASDISALRFSRGSDRSSSNRSNDSTDSGVLKSSPDRVAYNPPLRQKPRAEHPSRQVSLHSLLEALPAASVDTGLFDSANKSKGNSLSSLSLDSRSSDYDSYFYI